MIMGVKKEIEHSLDPLLNLHVCRQGGDDNALKSCGKPADKLVGGLYKGIRSTEGQAAIEFIFVLPLVLLLMLWCFQFFYAIHTSNINQKQARIELMGQIQNYRDLRFADEFNRKNASHDYHNDGWWYEHLNRDHYRNRFENNKTYFSVSVLGSPGGEDAPQRTLGEPGAEETSKGISIRTNVGICRDEECN